MLNTKNINFENSTTQKRFQSLRNVFINAVSLTKIIPLIASLSFYACAGKGEISLDKKDANNGNPTTEIPCSDITEFTTDTSTSAVAVTHPNAGTVIATPDATAMWGGTGTRLVAVPAKGYMFDHWTGGTNGNNLTNPTWEVPSNLVNMSAVFLSSVCTEGVPVISNPADGFLWTTSNEITFSWTFKPEVTRYGILMSKDSSFSVNSPSTYVTFLSGNSITTIEGFGDDGIWFYKVRGNAPFFSNYSSVRTIVVQPYTVPFLSFNPTLDGDLTEWSAINPATEDPADDQNTTNSENRNGTDIHQIKMGQKNGELYFGVNFANGTIDNNLWDVVLRNGQVPSNASMNIVISGQGPGNNYISLHITYKQGTAGWYRGAFFNNAEIDTGGGIYPYPNGLSKIMNTVTPNSIETSININEITSRLTPYTNPEGNSYFKTHVEIYRENGPGGTFPSVDSTNQIRFKL